MHRDRSRALTGTPIENKPDHLVNQFAFIDPERIPPETPARRLAAQDERNHGTHGQHEKKRREDKAMSAGRVAAVYGEDGAGDEAGVVGGEEGDGGGNFFHPADAADRVAGDQHVQ
jgi:hypothetical protein